MSFRPRTALNVAAIALVGLLGFTSCNSQPGHRRVVQDMVDALGLPSDQEQCMLATVEEDYTDNDLEQIAEQNEDLDFADDEFVAAGTEQYQRFVADLTACTDRDAAASVDAAATESTVVSESTDVSDTTDAPETSAT